MNVNLMTILAALNATAYFFFNFYLFIFLKCLGIHVSQANCKQSHERESLCCKTGAQYAEYFSTVSKRDPAQNPYGYITLI